MGSRGAPRARRASCPGVCQPEAGPLPVQLTATGASASSALHVAGVATPFGGEPVRGLELLEVGGGLRAEDAGGFLARDGGREVLLEPEHLVAAGDPARVRAIRCSAVTLVSGASASARPFQPAEPVSCQSQKDSPWRRSRPPPRGSGPVRRRRVFIGLPEREDRAPVDAVGDVGVRVDRVDRLPDRLPVHLRRVELRAAGPEEHGVGERLVVGDVGEGRERQRVARADLRAQVGEVGLGRRVVAFVLGLGVDHEAVGAVGDGLCAERRLAARVAPVDVLPRADLDAGGVQGRRRVRVRTGPSSCSSRPSSSRTRC